MHRARLPGPSRGGAFHRRTGFRLEPAARAAAGRRDRMTNGMERLMDDLPDLQSDADVDALMGRLRAKLAPVSLAPVSSAPSAGAPPMPATTGAFGELVAAQEALVVTIVRAM